MVIRPLIYPINALYVQQEGELATAPQKNNMIEWGQ